MKGTLTIKNDIYHVIISYKNKEGEHKKKWFSTGLQAKNNKRAAEEAMREIVAKFKAQQQSPIEDKEQVNNKLFSDYLFEWLELAKVNLQASTYSSYLDNVKQIAKYFKEKNTTLSGIKPADIYEYYKDVVLSGGSVQKCEHHHVVIHRALQVAYRTEMIPVNPADKVERPKSPKYQAKYYDYKKMLKLFESLPGDRLELAYFTAALTGLRRSEVCGIKWDAIDFDSNLLHINHAAIHTKVNGRRTIVFKDIMKNKTSRRTLPLLPVLKERFLQEKTSQDSRKTTYGLNYNRSYLNYVFVDEIGDFLKPNTISSHFDVLLKQCGLPKIRFHDLRHSFASLLLACGASLKEVSEWLGHSTITITSDLYGHLDFNSKLTIANTISKLFGYEAVENSEENSPYNIIRKIFSGNQVENKIPVESINNNNVVQLDTNEAKSSREEYRIAKQEMQRLGFDNIDEYFDYLDYLTKKKSRSKNNEIEM